VNQGERPVHARPAASHGESLSGHCDPGTDGRNPAAGQALADIHGQPMIVRVIEQALASGVETVLVAAGDREIVAAVEAAGHQAILTDPALPSGTDRILAALDQLDPDGRFDPVINLQGDMPTFDPGLLRVALQALKIHPEADIATLVSPTMDDAERQDPNVVKAVLAGDGQVSPARCLYFTRATARPVTGRCSATWACMFTAGRRWNGSWPCRPPRLNSARSWSNCGHWKTA
jgi:CTP:molybdopterin cytidylyltransferase MocA